MSIIATPRRSSTSTAPSSSIDRAVKALRRELAELGYNPRVSEEITSHAYRERTLAGLVELGAIDAEDLDRLTEAMVAGFGEVPINSKAWDRIPGHWMTAADILPAPSSPAVPTEARLEQAPVPAESRAFARQLGVFDVRRRPTIDDWKDWRNFNAWREEHYVVPDVLEAEAAEIGRPFSRCY